MTEIPSLPESPHVVASRAPRRQADLYVLPLGGNDDVDFVVRRHTNGVLGAGLRKHSFFGNQEDLFFEARRLPEFLDALSRVSQLATNGRTLPQADIAPRKARTRYLGIIATILLLPFYLLFEPLFELAGVAMGVGAWLKNAHHTITQGPTAGIKTDLGIVVRDNKGVHPKPRGNVRLITYCGQEGAEGRLQVGVYSTSELSLDLDEIAIHNIYSYRTEIQGVVTHYQALIQKRRARGLD